MELQEDIIKVENYKGRFLIKMTKPMELQEDIIKVENYNGKPLL